MSDESLTDKLTAICTAAGGPEGEAKRRLEEIKNLFEQGACDSQ